MNHFHFASKEEPPWYSREAYCSGILNLGSKLQMEVMTLPKLFDAQNLLSGKNPLLPTDWHRKICQRRAQGQAEEKRKALHGNACSSQGPSSSYWLAVRPAQMWTEVAAV